MQKIVLLMLANRANHDTGQCNPSYDRLASECGMSVRACKDQIQHLANAGLIEVQKRFKEGVSLPNQYILAMQLARVQEMPARVQEVHGGSAGDARGVVQEMHTKQEVEPVIEPVKTKTKRSDAAPQFDAINFLLGNGVEKQIALDWLKVRTKKRAANSQTAFDEVFKNIKKADLPVNDALRICCSRGWAGFEGAWIENRQQPRAGPAYQTANEKAKSLADRLTGKTRNEQPNTLIDIN